MLVRMIVIRDYSLVGFSILTRPPPSRGRVKPSAINLCGNVSSCVLREVGERNGCMMPLTIGRTGSLLWRCSRYPAKAGRMRSGFQRICTSITPSALMLICRVPASMSGVGMASMLFIETLRIISGW